MGIYLPSRVIPQTDVQRKSRLSRRWLGKYDKSPSVPGFPSGFQRVWGIRTLDRTLATIPNALFSSMSLENLSRRDKMLFHPMLNLRRDTTPAQVRSVLDAIHRILTDDRRIEAGNLPVRFIGVGSYSLDVEVFCYILTGDGNEFLRIQQELLLRILDTARAAGTALALPTQASVVYSAETPALASR